MKALHRTEICGMRATVKMARDKEEERAQQRDRMLREEMEKRKRRLNAEKARKEGSYRTRDDWDRDRAGGSSSTNQEPDHPTPSSSSHSDWSQQ